MEDGTKLDHCGAEFLSACFGWVEPRRDGMRRAVIFHDAGVGDGNIRGALFKDFPGIAAGLEQRSDQVISLSDCGRGFVDEAGLHGFPIGVESLPLGDAEFADCESVCAGIAAGQSCLGVARRAVLENSAAVLRSKTNAERSSAGSALKTDPCNGNCKE